MDADDFVIAAIFNPSKQWVKRQHLIVFQYSWLCFNVLILLVSIMSQFSAFHWQLRRKNGIIAALLFDSF